MELLGYSRVGVTIPSLLGVAAEAWSARWVVKMVVRLAKAMPASRARELNSEYQTVATPRSGGGPEGVMRPRSNNPNHPSLFEGVPVRIGDFRREREAVAIAAICEYVDRFGLPPTSEAWVKSRMTPSEKTIRRRFGSFRAAIKAAGFQ